MLERRLVALREAVPEITTLEIRDVRAPSEFPREQATALFVDLAFSVLFARTSGDESPQQYNGVIDVRFQRATL